MRLKIMSAEAAVSLIRNGDTVALTGFGMLNLAEELLAALEKRFLSSGTPHGLTILHAAGIGGLEGAGLEHVAHEGMIVRVIGGFYGSNPGIVSLVNRNKIQAYNFPQGVVCHLYRAIASGKSGEITKVGLRTSVDPRLEGGKLNVVTTEDLVELIEINGQEWLRYRSMPIQAAIIRGTSADENGNVTMEDEAALSEALSIAQATRASRGKVLVQVKNLVRAGTLNAQMVRIPGALVDAVVLCSAPEKFHRQTAHCYMNPALAGQVKVPAAALSRVPLDERKVIARRAALELVEDTIVNLGIGVPEIVAQVAAEEGIQEQFTLTVESGPTGGVPAFGPNFGAAVNAAALIDQTSQFDFYDGGGLDVAFLGMAQMDQDGNVNVARFGPRISGCGGFINISQNTRKVVFCGKFTTGGLRLSVGDGQLRVLQEGRQRKLVAHVEQVTFSARFARESEQEVLYVTERAVFRLEARGPVLIEVAPGIDMRRDILEQMEFRPTLASTLQQMDARIFRDEPMQLRAISQSCRPLATTIA